MLVANNADLMARNLRHCARALAIVRAALLRKNANKILKWLPNERAQICRSITGS